jgi:hypothetical protein
MRNIPIELMSCQNPWHPADTCPNGSHSLDSVSVREGRCTGRVYAKATDMRTLLELAMIEDSLASKCASVRRAGFKRLEKKIRSLRRSSKTTIKPLCSRTHD